MERFSSNQPEYQGDSRSLLTLALTVSRVERATEASGRRFLRRCRSFALLSHIQLGYGLASTNTAAGKSSTSMDFQPFAGSISGLVSGRRAQHGTLALK
jgi:hypothetical protein